MKLSLNTLKRYIDVTVSARKPSFGFLVVSLDAFSLSITATELTLRLSMALLSGLSIALYGFAIVFMDTASSIIAASKFKLCIGIVMIGRFAIPFSGFNIVLFDLVSDSIVLRKLKLSIQVSGKSIHCQLLYALVHGKSPLLRVTVSDRNPHDSVLSVFSRSEFNIARYTAI